MVFRSATDRKDSATARNLGMIMTLPQEGRNVKKGAGEEVKAVTDRMSAHPLPSTPPLKGGFLIEAS